MCCENDISDKLVSEDGRAITIVKTVCAAWRHGEVEQSKGERKLGVLSSPAYAGQWWKPRLRKYLPFHPLVLSPKFPINLLSSLLRMGRYRKFRFHRHRHDIYKISLSRYRFFLSRLCIGLSVICRNSTELYLEKFHTPKKFKFLKTFWGQNYMLYTGRPIFVIVCRLQCTDVSKKRPKVWLVSNG